MNVFIKGPLGFNRKAILMKNNEFEKYLAKYYEAINKADLTTEQLTHVAGELIDNISLFDADELDSDYYCPILDKIFDELLARGIDLNLNIDANPVACCIWISNKDIAVMLMKKFLGHGANPNLYIDCDSNTIYDTLCAYLLYDIYRHKVFIYMWLLFLAYGGDQFKGYGPDMKEGYDISIFKNIERYDFCINIVDQNNVHNVVYIYDKKTQLVVGSF